MTNDEKLELLILGQERLEEKINSLIEYIIKEDAGIDQNSFKDSIDSEKIKNMNEVIGDFKKKLEGLKKIL